VLEAVSDIECRTTVWLNDAQDKHLSVRDAPSSPLQGTVRLLIHPMMLVVKASCGPPVRQQYNASVAGCHPRNSGRDALYKNVMEPRTEHGVPSG